jgi:hypothetical protein
VPLDYAQTLANRASLLQTLAELKGEDRRARLLAALADSTTALELLRDVPLAYAATLNNRAGLLSDLAGLEGEDCRARLLAALADCTTALELRRDVPLDYAQTLTNRAVLLSDLAGLEGEDRRTRLLTALRDAWRAVQLFEQYQHAIYFKMSQRVLRNIKFECGADFESYWQAAVGQPQPAWLQRVDPMVCLEKLRRMLLRAWLAVLPARMIDEDLESRLKQLLPQALPELREPLRRKLEEVRQRRRNPTLADRVRAWVRTPDWSTSRTYLEQHQDELLTDAAEQVLRDLARQHSGERQWSQHLEILRRARRDGIAAAYAHILLAALLAEMIDEDDER